MPMPVYSFKDSTVRLFPSCREWAVRKRTVGECVRFDVIGWRPCSSNGHGSGPLEEHLLMCSELPGSASEYGRIHDRIEGGGSAEGCYACNPFTQTRTITSTISRAIRYVNPFFCRATTCSSRPCRTSGSRRISFHGLRNPLTAAGD